MHPVAKPIPAAWQRAYSMDKQDKPTALKQRVRYWYSTANIAARPSCFKASKRK